jgi:hypothetical protein
MPYGTGGDFKFHLHNCMKLQNVDNLIQEIGALVREFNLTIIDAIGLSPISLDHSKREFNEYCHSQYETGKGNWDEDFRDTNADGRLYLLMNHPSIPTPPNDYRQILMAFNIYGHEYNQVLFSMDLGLGGRHLWAERVTEYQVILVNLYTKMAKFLIPLLAPEYAVIYETEELLYGEFAKPKDVINRNIKFIYWGNYFAPGFLSQEQEKIFINSPVGVTKLAEDGLWYYLSEDFSSLPDSEVWAVEERARKYFSGFFNLTRVYWRFVVP